MSEQPNGWNWGRLGSVGSLFLAGYLLVVGIGALVGTAIPPWFTAILAVAAGVLILVGR